MRVLVCGGRDFSDILMFARVMGQAFPTPGSVTAIIHGGARGADAMAGEWAKSRSIPCEVFAAEWNVHGRAAGPIRNQRMLEEGRPDLVVAFPGGAGTRDMLQQAERAGVPRYEFPTRFLLDPGDVISQADGQRHYIEPGRLAQLYGVPLAKCVRVSDPRGRGNWPANWPVLSPRFDGRYFRAKGLEEEWI